MLARYVDGTLRPLGKHDLRDGELVELEVGTRTRPAEQPPSFWRCAGGFAGAVVVFVVFVGAFVAGAAWVSERAALWLNGGPDPGVGFTALILTFGIVVMAVAFVIGWSAQLDRYEQRLRRAAGQAGDSDTKA